MIAYITICIATLVSFINLLTKTSVDVEGKKNLKKPTRAGWVLLFISVTSLFIAIFSKMSDNANAEKEKMRAANARSIDSINQANILKSTQDQLASTKDLLAITTESRSLAIESKNLAVENKSLAEAGNQKSESLYQHSMQEAARLRKENKQQKRLMLGAISTPVYFRLNLSTDISSSLGDAQRNANWNKARGKSGAPASLFFTDSTDRIILFPGYALKKLPASERIGYFEIQSADKFRFYSRISFFSNSTIAQETHLYGEGGVPAWRDYQWDFYRYGPNFEINAASLDTNQKTTGVQLFDLLEKYPLAIELHYELRGTASQKEMKNIKAYWEAHFRQMDFLFGFDRVFNKNLTQAMKLESVTIVNGNMVARWVKSGEAQYEAR